MKNSTNEGDVAPPEIVATIKLAYPKAKFIDNYDLVMRPDFELARRQQPLVLTVVTREDLFQAVPYLGKGLVSGYLYGETKASIMHSLLFVAAQPGVLLLNFGRFPTLREGNVEEAVQEAVDKYCIQCKCVHYRLDKFTPNKHWVNSSAVPLLYKLAGASTEKQMKMSLDDIHKSVQKCVDSAYTVTEDVNYTFDTKNNDENVPKVMLDWVNAAARSLDPKLQEYIREGYNTLCVSVLATNLPRLLVVRMVDNLYTQFHMRYGLNVVRIMWRFDTAFDRPCVSVSCIPLGDADGRVKLLDAAYESVGACLASVSSVDPHPIAMSPKMTRPMSAAPRKLLCEALRDPNVADVTFVLPNTQTYKTSQKVVDVLKKLCDVLVDNEQHITHLDIVCGDGDCGKSLRELAMGVLKCLERGDIPATITDDDWATSEFYLTLGEYLSHSTESSFGIIHGMILMKFGAYMAGCVENCDKVAYTQQQVADCLMNAVEDICHYKAVQVGMRTLFDALVPAVKAFKEASSHNKSFGDALESASVAAQQGADSTKTMVPKVGRSTFVPFKKLEGTHDPGAWVVAKLVSTLQVQFK